MRRLRALRASVAHVQLRRRAQGRHSRRRGCDVAVAAKGPAALRELAEIREESKLGDAAVCKGLKWDAPLTVRKYPDPVLRQPNAKVGVFGEQLRKLADEMFDVMYKDDGMGLAAPQVGVNLRLMVFNEAGERGKGQEMVLANPRIISNGKKTWTHEEACLSFVQGRERVLGDVQRPYVVKIKAQDADGKAVRTTLEGWPARVFQHEFDHLEGVLFPDRIPSAHLERERAKLEALEKAYTQSHPEVKYKSVLERRAGFA